MSPWNILRWVRAAVPTAPIRRRPQRRSAVRLLLEHLEDRLAPATFTVTDNSDSDNDMGGPVAIDGNHAVTVFTVSSGVTASLSGLTIQNGNASVDGGGICNSSGTLTVTDQQISTPVVAAGA